MREGLPGPGSSCIGGARASRPRLLPPTAGPAPCSRPPASLARPAGPAAAVSTPAKTPALTSSPLHTLSLAGAAKARRTAPRPDVCCADARLYTGGAGCAGRWGKRPRVTPFTHLPGGTPGRVGEGQAGSGGAFVLHGVSAQRPGGRQGCWAARQRPGGRRIQPAPPG